MMEELPSLIETLGFPMAISLLLFWMLYYTNKVHREEREKTQEILAKAIRDFTTAISDLKTEIVKLNERCEGGKMG